jgi:hypothetical protein
VNAISGLARSRFGIWPKSWHSAASLTRTQMRARGETLMGCAPSYSLYALIVARNEVRSVAKCFMLKQSSASSSPVFSFSTKLK